MINYGDLLLVFVFGVSIGVALVLFFTCKHKYLVFDTLDKVDGNCKSKVYVSRCEECGKINYKVVK